MVAKPTPLATHSSYVHLNGLVCLLSCLLGLCEHAATSIDEENYLRRV
jgi:hypothetical protein